MPQRRTRARNSVDQNVKPAKSGKAAATAKVEQDENANASAEKVLLSLRQVFDRAQDTSLQHAQLSERLKELYDQSSRQRFVDAFIIVLRSVMVQPEMNKYAMLICDFVASFVNSVNDEEEDAGLFRSVLKFLLKSHDVASKQVRFYCCVLVGKVLAKRSDSTEMDTAICSAIESRMLERLTDRSTHVRVQAIHALARLQDPQHASECRVIKALSRVLRTDPRFEVRRAALERVVVCRSTLSAILQRLHDANEQVRRVAFGVVGERLNVAALTSKRRVAVLRAACDARAPLVTEAARRCFDTWERKAEVSATKKGATTACGFVELLRRFDLFDAEEAPLVERMLLMCFEGATADRRASLIQTVRRFLNDSNLPTETEVETDDNLVRLPPVEAIFFWRVLITHLRARVDKMDPSKETGQRRHLETDTEDGDDLASISTVVDCNMMGRQMAESQLEIVLPSAAILSSFIDRSLDELVNGDMYSAARVGATGDRTTAVTMLGSTTIDPSAVGRLGDSEYDPDGRFETVRRGMLALKQLILALEKCGEELDEEGTRRCIRDLLYRHALLDRRVVLFNDGELTGALVRLARRVETRETHFIAQLGETIAELRRPTDLGTTAAQLQLQSASTREEPPVETTSVHEGGAGVGVELTGLSIVANAAQAAEPPRPAAKRRSATLSDQLVKIADTKLRINELREAITNAVTAQDFDTAGRLKRELQDAERARDELTAEYDRLRSVDVNEDVEPNVNGVIPPAAPTPDVDGVTPAKRIAIGEHVPGEMRAAAAVRDVDMQSDAGTETETENETDADVTLTSAAEDGELLALNADGEMDIEAERARQRESVRGQLVHDPKKGRGRRLNELNDPETLAACLTILRESLSHTRLRDLHATLRALADSLVLRCVSNADETVRRLAFHCLALASLMDAELARRHFAMFAQVYRLDRDEMKQVAMQFFFDAICLFGAETFGLPREVDLSKRLDGSTVEIDDSDADTLTTSQLQQPGANDSTPNEQLYKSLIGYLSVPNAKLSSVAGEGLAKLLLNNRLVCADAFSALFLSWFDSTALLTGVTRQAIATFLQTYAYCSPEHQLLVGTYSTATLRRAMRRAREAARRRAEADEDDEDFDDADDPNWDAKTIESMADLLVRLTDTRLRFAQHNLPIEYDENAGHDCLCECVWNEIALERSDSSALRIWTRMLSQVCVSALRRSAIEIERASVDDTMKEGDGNVDKSAASASVTVEQRAAVYRRWVQQAKAVQKRHKQDKKVVHYLATHVDLLEHRLCAFAGVGQSASAAGQLEKVAEAVEVMSLDKSKEENSEDESEDEATLSDGD